MATVFAGCAGSYSCPDCRRSLALEVMMALRSGDTTPYERRRMGRVVAGLEEGALRLLLDLSLPAMAIAGLDDLVEAIEHALHASAGAAAPAVRKPTAPASRRSASSGGATWDWGAPAIRRRRG